MPNRRQNTSAAQRAQQNRQNEAQDDEEIQSAVTRLALRSYPPSTRLFKVIRHPTSPAKGIGWFAKEKVMRGTPLLAEKELFFLIENPTNADVTSERDMLSPSDRASFNALNCPGENITPKNIFDTNNFTMHKTQQGQVKVGLFLEAARVNHSCIPNAFWAWNRMLDRLTIYAMVDIAKDDEITISYFSPTEYYTWRQRNIKLRNYGFSCDCIACERQSPFGGSSDARRAQMRSLQKKIDTNNYHADSFYNRLEDISMLENLLRQEKLNYPMRAQMCHLAAEWHRDTLVGDARRAASYEDENRIKALEIARIELEFDVACTGYKSPEVTKTLNFIRQLKSQ